MTTTAGCNHCTMSLESRDERDIDAFLQSHHRQCSGRSRAKIAMRVDHGVECVHCGASDPDGRVGAMVAWARRHRCPCEPKPSSPNEPQ